jgi:hypothetical protein
LDPSCFIKKKKINKKTHQVYSFEARLKKKVLELPEEDERDDENNDGNFTPVEEDDRPGNYTPIEDDDIAGRILEIYSERIKCTIAIGIVL